MSNHTAIATTEQTAQNGAFSFDSSAIIYHAPSGEVVSTPISEIAIIGEFTTPDGPFADDWFLVFVMRGTGQWMKFTMYAAGIEMLTGAFSDHLGCRVQVGLANRADFTSRIMWPLELVDQPLFTVIPVREGNLLRRLVSSIIPETKYHLSSEVLLAAG